MPIRYRTFDFTSPLRPGQMAHILNHDLLWDYAKRREISLNAVRDVQATPDSDGFTFEWRSGYMLDTRTQGTLRPTLDGGTYVQGISEITRLTRRGWLSLAGLILLVLLFIAAALASGLGGAAASGIIIIVLSLPIFIWSEINDSSARVSFLLRHIHTSVRPKELDT